MGDERTEAPHITAALRHAFRINRERLRQLERLLEECVVAVEDQRNGDAALVAELMRGLADHLTSDLRLEICDKLPGAIGTTAANAGPEAYRGHPLGHAMYEAVVELEKETVEQDDPDRQAWMAAAAKECRNCPNCGNPPCDGCLAGGVCDAMDCYCNEESEPADDDDANDDMQAMEESSASAALAMRCTFLIGPGDPRSRCALRANHDGPHIS